MRFGKLLERLGQGINSITNLIFSLVVDLAPAVIRFLVAVAILWLFNFRLALILLAALPLFVIITWWRGRVMASLEKQRRNLWERLGQKNFTALG